MKKQLIAATLVLAGAISSCKKDSSEAIDTTYPVIDVSLATAFPKQCSVVKRGEKFTFRAQLSDNAELGSVSVDIHHNFDHHSHSTEVESCSMDPVKTPVKPLLQIKNFTIPAGLKTYEVQQEFTIPADVDPGDYHFMIMLTDKEGWQTLKGLSIKVS